MTAIIFRFLLTILWELVILVWEFYMLQSNIDVIFCDVISKRQCTIPVTLTFDL